MGGLVINNVQDALFAAHKLQVECHVPHAAGGPDRLALDTGAVKAKGLHIDFIVDHCPAGAHVSKRGERALCAYLIHFVLDAPNELQESEVATGVRTLVLECVKDSREPQRPVVPVRPGLSKPILY
jgi:hypothetical protein